MSGLINSMSEELKKNNIRINIGENYIRAEWVYYYDSNPYSKTLNPKSKDFK